MDDIGIDSAVIASGLKHFRSLAKQDLQLAEAGERLSEVRFARARLATYRALACLNETHGADEATDYALQRYRDVPMVDDAFRDRWAGAIGEAHALENFFRLAGLDESLHEEACRHRPRVIDSPTVVS